MNKYLLTLIQGIHVSVKRIYFRMEDPGYPYAFGVLLPAITIITTDKDWNKVSDVEDPEIMYKTVQIQDFQVFMIRNHTLSQIDKVMRLEEI